MRFPSGSSSGQYRLAMVSLMTITPGAFCESSSVKSRPLISLIPIVWK